MEMKYSEVIVRHQELLEIAKLKLPRKIALAVARNIMALEKEQKLYSDQRKDIADRYAKKDKAGEFVTDDDMYTFDDVEKKSLFTKETNELNNTVINIDVMKFDEKELDECHANDRYDIPTPIQEVWLDWMIDNSK